jgi:SulP family sulfate permease
MVFKTLKHFKEYSLSDARSDLMAGLIVAVMLIPQGMAYALLAGLPPIYGLYAGLTPLLIYPFLGSSRHLSVGPAALMALIIYSGLSPMAEPMSERFIQLSITTAAVAGAMQVILSVIRMGYLVNFLSQPVIRGFTTAAAVIIIMSQLRFLLGIETSRSGNTLLNLYELVTHLDRLQWLTALFGTVSLSFILWVKFTGRRLPASLLMVSISSLIVFGMSWNNEQLELIGQVPEGLPRFVLPDLRFSTVMQVLPIAAVVCLISFIESLSIAKVIAAKTDNSAISGNRELWALGWSKLISSFFQSHPNTGSFSRSALNADAGAQTGLSSIWTAVFTGLSLMFFTGLFYYLPQTVLAAVVIASVISLVDISEAKKLIRRDKKDFYVFTLTFGLTVAFGILEGVLAGVILSLIFILYKASRPHYAELGSLPESAIYKSVDRFRAAQTQSEYLIFRYDADLFFANAEHFYESIVKESRKKEGLKVIIIDASAIGSIDSTGISQLRLLKEAADKSKIELYLTGVKGPVRDILDRHQVFEWLPRKNFFLNVDLAISYLDNKTAKSLPNPEKVDSKDIPPI